MLFRKDFHDNNDLLSKWKYTFTAKRTHIEEAEFDEQISGCP